MEEQIGLSIRVLVFLGFAFGVLGFLARDELRLRIFMLTASVLYLFYYYHVASTPLWESVITNAILGGVNLAMILVIVLERTTLAMSHHTAALFRHFSMLTPGQFRRMLRPARHLVAEEPIRLTRQGGPVNRLWYVHHGTVRIDKGDGAVHIDAPMFVGELAFLTGAAASASVTIEAGAQYLEWNAAALRRLTAKSARLDVALQAEFNADLVRKVTCSTPLTG